MQQRARDSDPLLQAARKRADRISLARRSQADTVQKIEQSFFGIRNTVEAAEEFQVVERRKILVHESVVRQKSDPAPGLFRPASRYRILRSRGSPGWTHQPGCDFQKRGFPGAVASEERDELAAPHLQTDVPNGKGIPELLLNLLRVECQRFGHLRAPPSPACVRGVRGFPKAALSLS